MDRFLDEQESPAPLDRVSLAAVSATDCEPVTSQQQVSTDDIKPSTEVHANGKLFTPHSGEGDVKPPISNGESLTVANNRGVCALPLSDGNTLSTSAEPVTGSTTIDFAIKSCADTDADVLHTDPAAEATEQSNSVTGSSSEINKSSLLLPPCPKAHDVMLSGSSHTEQMETGKACAFSSESVVFAAVPGERAELGSDIRVISEPLETAASSSSSAATIPLCLDDNKPLSPESHRASDTGIQPQSIGLDAELSASSVQPLESHAAGRGSATAADVDEVKPGDVDLLLAAVDLATSVAGSLYSNVDPMTTALEFSSSATSMSAELLGKTDASDSCTNSSVLSSSQVTDSQPPESTLLLKSSGTLSDGGGSALISHLAPNHTDASVSGSVVCKSDSVTTSNVMHGAGDDVEKPVVEPSAAVVPSSTGDSLSTSEGVVLPDEMDSGSRARTVDDQAAAFAARDENNGSLSKNTHCPKQNELSSLNTNQVAELCLQSKNICVSDPDASAMQADGTDVKTNSDSILVSLTSRELTQSDRLGDDEHCSLDKSDSTDSRSLLAAPSDADYTSSAS